MLGARALVRAAPRAMLGARQMNVISGPPTERISFAEKCVHGVLISLGILAIPVYVAVNIRSYKARE